MLWTALIELTTELGGLCGIYFLRGLPVVWLGIIFANVGGGFLYLVSTTLGAVRDMNIVRQLAPTSPTPSNTPKP